MKLAIRRHARTFLKTGREDKSLLEEPAEATAAEAAGACRAQRQNLEFAWPSVS